jgi:iron complex transport system permease protein
LCVGAVAVGPLQVVAILARQLGIGLPWTFEGQQETVLTVLRLPRVGLAVLVGMGLAVAGTAMQGLYRSPLADPVLVGVGSGAAFAAVAAIGIGGAVAAGAYASGGAYVLPLIASLGALLAGALVYRVASVSGRTIVATMLLTGIALNAMLGAATALITFASRDALLRDVTFWSLGSLAGASWRSVVAGALPILVAVVLLPRQAPRLDALALGEAEAGHLGVDVPRLRRIVIVLVALAVGASVAVAGVIAFVGLVVPTLVRRWVGAEHRLVLPASALLGAALLVLADLVARTVISPVELPIGVVTAVVGGPFLLWLLLREHGRVAR